MVFIVLDHQKTLSVRMYIVATDWAGAGVGSLKQKNRNTKTQAIPIASDPNCHHLLRFPLVHHLVEQLSAVASPGWGSSSIG